MSVCSCESPDVAVVEGVLVCSRCGERVRDPLDAKRDQTLALIARTLADMQRQQREILERLDGSAAETDTDALLGPAELARRLGRSRSWVYEHAGELGAIRVGNGSRPRLLFDPELARERLTRRSGPAESESEQRPRGQRRPAPNGAPLLPVKDRTV